jgi:hypothetical protein
MTEYMALLQRCRMDPRWASEEIVHLRDALATTQKNLDQAVGYKLAAAEIPKGEWDRD